jgi:hypothetical protein
MNLGTMKAEAARRAYTEFMWNVTLTGDTTKNLFGLANQSASPRALRLRTAPARSRPGSTANGNATKTRRRSSGTSTTSSRAFSPAR